MLQVLSGGVHYYDEQKTYEQKPAYEQFYSTIERSTLTIRRPVHKCQALERIQSIIIIGQRYCVFPIHISGQQVKLKKFLMENQEKRIDRLRISNIIPAFRKQNMIKDMYRGVYCLKCFIMLMKSLYWYDCNYDFLEKLVEISFKYKIERIWKEWIRPVFQIVLRNLKEDCIFIQNDNEK